MNINLEIDDSFERKDSVDSCPQNFNPFDLSQGDLILTKQFKSANKGTDLLNQSNLITEEQGLGGQHDPGYITFFPIFNNKEGGKDTPHQNNINHAGRKISTIMMLNDENTSDRMESV